MLLSVAGRKDARNSRSSPQGIMLPKKLRVPLQHFPRNSKTIARTKNLTMKSAANNLVYNRGGVVIGKSVGVAAQRNRLKRSVMGIFQSSRSFMDKTTSGKDFVIFVGSNAIKGGFSGLNEELRTYGKLF